MFKKKEKTDAAAPVKEKTPKPPKDKSRAAVIRKNQAATVLRVILWIMIGFIFLRGAISCVKHEDTQSAMEEIKAYETQVDARQSEQAGLLAFAEDFTREYLRYDKEDEADYLARMGQFAASSVYQDVHLKGNASISNVNAYRTEKVANGQYDVFVHGNAKFTEFITSTGKDKKTETKEKVTEQLVTLRVPVAVQNGAYIIEDTPVFVANQTAIQDYKNKSYSGSSATETVSGEIEQALTNFFTAYYKDDASVIAYFLDPDAKPEDFIGLDGAVSFQGLKECKVYTVDGGYLALATVEILLPNGQNTTQNMRLTVTAADGQYHVKTMNTRIQNID